ncbi:MAG TPA: hypothetical protein VEG65_04275 [Candidatus Bathyarchaeia archaeon]|nr:hypothetical protein [Candidatus Bathyarchaeia archaeon]
MTQEKLPQFGQRMLIESILFVALYNVEACVVYTEMVMCVRNAVLL